MNAKLHDRRTRGFTLIEVLVSMVIALALIIALGTISSRYETSKRQNSSSADLSLNLGYLAYDMDRRLRSAGSGFINTATSEGRPMGCRLMAARSGAQVLPRTAAFPAPFAGVSTNVRLLPVVVWAGAGANNSDIIQTITGAGSMSEFPIPISAVQVNAFRARSSLGLQGNDLVLVTETGKDDCMMQQVLNSYNTAGEDPVVPLGGTYAAAAVGTTSLVSYGLGKASAVVLGNTTSRQPQFQLLGINTANQLVSYDMLRLNTPDAIVPLADNVVDMRVRYGVDAAGADTGVVNSWVLPTGTYSAANLNTNTEAATLLQRRILALRVAMIVRSDRIERPRQADGTDLPGDRDVSPASLTMFSSLASNLQATYAISAEERRRKYRLVEFTIPLRNVILSAPERVVPN